MPITILDYVRAQAGEKDVYTGEDFARNGVDMLGGCKDCGATLGPYNAYPSKTGYWRCANCIRNLGYATVDEFRQAECIVNCPSCGETENIHEIRVTRERSEGYAFECGECSLVWT
jgi:hypothetical protein